MSAHEMVPVMASYHRCRADEHFTDTFYALFLAQSPTIAKMFEHTDFKRQKLMLRESLLEMLCYDSGVQGSEAEIIKIAERHKGLGITADMYTMWLDSLIEAVKQHDPLYTVEIGRHWRDAMQKGITLMLSQ